MTMITPKRFWERAAVASAGPEWEVRLDGRTLRTPAGAPLALPTEALARAVAAEWDAVADTIRPETMPLTRAANTSIDSVARDPAPVIETIADYGGSDLLCYRAEAPEALRQRQFAAWDPVLAWAAEALDARLVAVMGVIHVPQPEESLIALRRAVAENDAFRLTALSELVALSGSLVLGLAVLRGALAGEVAWRLSRIDEDWQEEQWGRDAEAHRAAEARRAAFLDAERLLRLLER
jgi:chaperone required for assembly of F1-ATPase